MSIAIKVDDLDDGNSLDKKGSVINSEKQKSVSFLEKRKNLRSKDQVIAFDIPLSLFHYKGYSSDFFTSWYNVSSEIFKEINRACPERRVLSLALSVLMLPYLAFVALGLVIFNRFKVDDKTQAGFSENKIKGNKVSRSILKKIVYNVLTVIVIFINIAMLMVLVIPATLTLAIFYLLNRELSHFLIAALRISMGLYHNEYRSIKVSFCEVSPETGTLNQDVAWDMKIKFPPQFGQLLRDLCQNKNGKLFVAQNVKH
ncbi:MAG: hypothetical protein K0T53_02235, partial [Wolbachia pipientis]|nr:hypothetical protein [Wolbachia pipientis]